VAMEKSYMNLRRIGACAVAAAAVLGFSSWDYAQTARAARSARTGSSSSASHVAAEVTKGKLDPAQSKPGDVILVKLKDDVRANGQIVYAKGTSITGVVRNVRNADPALKNEAKTQFQSTMQIEWLAPATQGKAARDVFFALQSVTQVNAIFKHQEETASDFGLPATDPLPATMAQPKRAAAANTGAGVLLGGAVNSALPSPVHETGQSNPALLSMPSVIAVDGQTSSAIDSTLGDPVSGQLFKVGHGQLITANGTHQYVDIFSHLNNDTVITSSSKDFEISSGAQMQMLVGVNRK